MDNPFANKPRSIFDKIEDKIKSIESETAKVIEEVKPVVEECIPVVEEIISLIPESEKAKILKQFGGIPSNIPITSPYWKMKF